MGVHADLKLAIRRLARAPGFALAVVLMLAVGLALSVAMFGVVRGVLGALPFPGGDRVVVLYGANPQQAVSNGGLTAAEVDRLALEDPASPFRAVGDFSWGGVTVFEAGRPREITVGVIGSGFFPALGLAPLHGRWFTAEEHAAGTGSIVLSQAEWQRQLGGRAEAIGQTVETDAGPAVVVGVMPASFGFPGSDVGGWVPHAAFESTRPGYRFQRSLYGVGWLKDSASDAQLAEWLERQAARVREQHGLPDEGWRFAAPSVLDDLVGPVRGTLWGGLAIALLVLLIACFNVAILLDARQQAMGHQEAVAHALGASARRLWLTRLLELGLQAGIGTFIGTLAAAGALAMVRAAGEALLPRADAIQMDGGVLLFAILLMVLVPVLVLLAAHWRRRGGVIALLRTGNGGMPRAGGARRLLPAMAIALSTISLVAALALTLSLLKLMRVEPGFRAEGVHALQFFRGTAPSQWGPFAEQYVARLAGLPGVDAVTVTTAAPLSSIGSQAEDVRPSDRPESNAVRSVVRRVGPGYLDVLEIPLLEGRAIGSGDREGGERVAVINRELARRSFGERSALGERIRLAVGRDGLQDYRIVGVMADIRNEGLRAPAAPEVLLSFAQQPWVAMTFLLSVRQPLPGLDRLMTEQLWQLASDQAITRQFSLTDEFDAQLQSSRFFAAIMGAFAVCALLLGMFGVYAVATLAQRRRVREFGLKLAIGARPALLGREVLADGLKLVVLGAAVGMAGAHAVLRLIAEQTYGLDRLLAGVTLAGGGLMALAALLAMLLPAWRAMRTDPLVALRD